MVRAREPSWRREPAAAETRAIPSLAREERQSLEVPDDALDVPSFLRDR